jgi:hypothetical protein
VRERLRLQLHRLVARVHTGGRAAVLWSTRITIAAVASYMVATLLFPGTQPLLAPLTAMLVVQVTPVSLLATGLDRVIAVAAGVSLAAGFAAVVPLEWWSLGVLIFVCITIGQVLRLRSNLIEVAISGMLVLGVGALGAESAAWERIAETLVGAGVGIVANLVFPPKVATADAGQAIDGLADSIKDLLNLASDELTQQVEDGGDPTMSARGWLGEARSITHDIPRIGAALIHAEEGRRLNVRAVGTPNVAPGLRQGLEALEHCAITIRAMFRAVVDAPWSAFAQDDDGDREIVDAVLTDLAQTFREMADGVDAFGQLVKDEADTAKRMSAADVQAVREALEGVHEARARLEDRLTAGVAPGMLELHAAVLTAVKRLLQELDLDERVRRQVRLLPRTRARRMPGARPSGRPPISAEPAPDDETQVLPAQPQDRWTRRHR